MGPSMPFFWLEVSHVVAREHTTSFLCESERVSDALGRATMIARYHNSSYARFPYPPYCFGDTRPQRIAE